MTKKIFLSPSNQNRNVYAWGDTTEDVQCGRIARSLEKALRRCGFLTKLEQYDSMQNRVSHSDAWGADVHVAIHTNATPSHNAGGTQVFYYAPNGYGDRACAAVYQALKDVTPGSSAECCRRWPTLYEVHKPRATSVYVEAEFHDVPEYARWIVEHTDEIAEAICRGICEYYREPYVPREEGSQAADGSRLYRVQVGAFREKANADRLAAELNGKGYATYIV